MTDTYHQTSTDQSVVIQGKPNFQGQFANQGVIELYSNPGDGALVGIARIHAPRPRLNGLFGKHCVIRPDGKMVASYDPVERIVETFSLIEVGDEVVISVNPALQLDTIKELPPMTDIEILFVNDRSELIVCFKDTYGDKQVSIDVHIEVLGNLLIYKDWQGWVYEGKKPVHQPKTFFKKV